MSMNLRASALALASSLIVTVLFPLETASANGLCFGQRPTIVGTNRDDKLRGTPRADVIMSLGGNDIVLGRGGSDRICTGDGRDRVTAGGGKDRVFAGLDLDQIRGGSGADHLLGGGDDYFHRSPNDADVVFGGAGDDAITGTEIIDHLSGGAGNDVIKGNGSASQEDGGWPDVLRGGDGDDKLIVGVRRPDYRTEMRGGAGDDSFHGTLYVVSYRSAPGPMTVVLGHRRASGEGTDSFAGDVLRVIGSPYDDHLVGSPGSEGLYGADGTDRIEGLAGDDGLVGDGENFDRDLPAGDDVVIGGDGADSFFDTDGADRYEGGAGRDEISYQFTDTSVEVDLVADTAANEGEVDTVADIEDVYGSWQHPNTLLGDDGANRLHTGLADNSRIEGRGGDDDLIAGGDGTVVDAGAGTDTIHCEIWCPHESAGGDGFDVLDLSETEIGEVDLATGTVTRNMTVSTFQSIEGAIGSEQQSTVIRGDDGNNLLVGGDRGDEIEGRGGDDEIRGRAGADSLDGGDGTDQIDGGDGRDTCTHGEALTRCE